MNILSPFAPLLRKLAKVYTSKERDFSYNNITVTIQPGVFHPGLFLSTKILLNFVHELDLENKSFLELGAGSGIISILAAKKNADVTATDISKAAIENIGTNADRNNVTIKVIESDLFNNIPEQKFEVIVINPPYYPKDPETEEDHAWFCGKNHEYFINLFSSLPGFIHSSSKVFMILSEVCQIKEIKSLAEKEGFGWRIQQRKTVWSEKNFIYSLYLI